MVWRGFLLHIEGLDSSLGTDRRHARSGIRLNRHTRIGCYPFWGWVGKKSDSKAGHFSSRRKESSAQRLYPHTSSFDEPSFSLLTLDRQSTLPNVSLCFINPFYRSLSLERRESDPSEKKIQGALRRRRTQTRVEFGSSSLILSRRQPSDSDKL